MSSPTSECKKRHLRLGDICDVCEKGHMRRASATKYKYIPDKAGHMDTTDYEMELECDNIDCQHLHKNERWLVGRGGSVDAVLEKSRSADGK